MRKLIFLLSCAALLMQSCGTIHQIASITKQESRKQTRNQNKAARILERAKHRALRLDPYAMQRDSITVPVMVKVPSISGSIQAKQTFTPPLGKFETRPTNVDRPNIIEFESIPIPMVATATFEFSDGSIDASIFFDKFIAFEHMPPPRLDYTLKERKVTTNALVPVERWEPTKEVPRRLTLIQRFLIMSGIILWITTAILAIITILKK